MGVGGEECGMGYSSTSSACTTNAITNFAMDSKKKKKKRIKVVNSFSSLYINQLILNINKYLAKEFCVVSLGG